MWGKSDRTMTVFVALTAATRAGTVARNDGRCEILHAGGPLGARRSSVFAADIGQLGRARIDNITNRVQVLQVFAVAEADRQILRRQAPWAPRNDVPVHRFRAEQRRRIEYGVTRFLEQLA